LDNNNDIMDNNNEIIFMTEKQFDRYENEFVFYVCIIGREITELNRNEISKIKTTLEELENILDNFVYFPNGVSKSKIIKANELFKILSDKLMIEPIVQLLLPDEFLKKEEELSFFR